MAIPAGPLPFNGVNGATGDYLLGPQTLDDIARAARRDRPDRDAVAPLGQRHDARTRGLPIDVAPEDVTQAGWGLVFHPDEPPDVRAQLQRLLEHRAARGVDPKRLKVLDYQPGETYAEFVTRHGTVPGSVVPWLVPLYLLVVGSPTRVPFQFTQDLDAEYAVGRLSFATAEEYGRYVDAVVAYETAPTVPNEREAVFFGTRHDFDAATQLSADHLICPLAGEPVPPDAASVCARNDFRLTLVLGDGSADRCAKAGTAGAPGVVSPAMRDVLVNVLRGRMSTGSRRPSLLITATHGVGFPLGDDRQARQQGALLCQDWPAKGQIAPADWLSADDVPDDAQLSGLVAVLFACYSAGTPEWDRFWRGEGTSAPQIANAPFVAALPQRLLAHPAGGALACIGHVERAWGNAIADVDAGPQLQQWQNLVGRILKGRPLGLALQDINDRYAMRAVGLLQLLDADPGQSPAADWQIAAAWLERNDAGGFILLGDPAVALRPAALAPSAGA